MATPDAIKASVENTIKAITPTWPGAARFALDSEDGGLVEGQAVPSGRERRFEVFWAGGGLGQGDDAIHHPVEQMTVETLRISVVYPVVRNLRELDNKIRSDVADIRQALNDPGNANRGDVVHQIVLGWAAPMHLDAEGCWIQQIDVQVKFFEAT